MANTWPIHFLNLKFYTQTCSQVLNVLQIVNWTHTFASMYWVTAATAVAPYQQLRETHESVYSHCRANNCRSTWFCLIQPVLFAHVSDASGCFFISNTVTVSIYQAFPTHISSANMLPVTELPLWHIAQTLKFKNAGRISQHQFEYCLATTSKRIYYLNLRNFDSIPSTGLDWSQRGLNNTEITYIHIKCEDGHKFCTFNCIF